MPRFPANPTPSDLRRLYDEGFEGSRCDPEKVAQLLGELSHPLFGASAWRIAGSGEGKVSLPFRAVLQFDPNAYEESQTTGDCVSHATRNAVDLTRAVEIVVHKERESWIARGATEGVYGSRGHGGQGMSCSDAARFVHQSGGILLRQPYPEIGLDLSRYNASIGSKWGRNGVPANVVAVAHKHQVKTISLVTTIAEARDALSNGYGLSVCSNFGFSSRRDAEGFAKPQGSWSHAMAWIACDDTGSRPGFLIQNSWGRWNNGPKRHKQPDGSFWIDYDVAKSMLAGRGAWAFSQVDGFPPRKLADWGASEFL